MANVNRRYVLAGIAVVLPTALFACNSIWGIEGGDYVPSSGADASAGSGGASGQGGSAGAGGVVPDAAGGTEAGVGGGAGSAGKAGTAGSSGAGGTSDAGPEADAAPCTGGTCNALWAHVYGDQAGGQFSLAIAADPAGNSAIVGRYEGTLPIGPGAPLQATMLDDDVFIGKFDDAGNPLWSFGYSATLYQLASGVGFDGNHNVYLAGHYKGPLTFTGPADAGSAALPNVLSTSMQSGFIASLDSTGAPRWAKQVKDGNHTVEIWSTATASDGSSIVAGYHDASGDTNPYGLNAIVRKYDANGVELWNRDSQNTHAQLIYAVGAARDPSGGSWVTGGFSGDFVPSAGGSCTTVTGDADAFLYRHNANGVCVALVAFGDNFDQDNQYAESVTVAQGTGEGTICGSFQGSIKFLGDGGAKETTNASQPDYSLFLAHFGSNGALLWSHHYGYSYGKRLYCRVAADLDGNIYVAGSLQGSIDFGGNPLQSNAVPATFLAKLDSSGVHQWSRVFQSDEKPDAGAVGVSIRGVAVPQVKGAPVYVTGWLYGAADFGGYKLTGAGDGDVFFAAFQP